MKRIVLILLFIVIGFIIKIPEYEELNNLAIINSIGISAKNEKITIIFKEIVPIKSDNGINYEYVYYKGDGSSLEDALKKVKLKTKKKIYLHRCKYLILDEVTSDDIINSLNINPKYIIHTNKNIEQYIKRDYY